MHVSRILLCSAVVAATAALAVETKTWVHSEVQEFEKGTLKGVSLSNSGHVSLAPNLTERLDAGAIHLWSAVAGSGGRVYAGGGEGKVYVLEASGKDASRKSRLLATLEGGGTVYAMLASGDALYAATSPDAKIWRVGHEGKASLLCATSAHYIWALIPADKGAMYAATGDPGQILKIDAQGKSTVLFDAGETHVRSLALDGNGNLIAGTDSSGVVLRVSAKGEGFVLQQTGKREVTAIAVARDGTIYAAASGNRGPAIPPPAAQPPTPPVPAPATAAPGQANPHQAGAQTAAQRAAAPPTVQPHTAPAGGSEIWRIGPDGEPTLFWNHSQALVYALAFDADGRLLAATGNQGRVYRIDSQQSYTRLVDTETSQITALALLPGGGIAAAAANPGKLFQVGPELETSGTLESDVFDAGSFTYWGRLRAELESNGGAVKIETRSGNLDTPEKNWSPWAAVDAVPGARVASPAARFFQWRATFTAQSKDAKRPPELSLVEVAYQQKNVAPVLDKIEITPYNHKFPASNTSMLMSGSSSNTLSLPPIGQVRRSVPSSPASESSGAVTMTYDKGWIGARWKASDANGDSLQYKIEYRGEQESEWKLLKDLVKENRYCWDATSFADGRYRLRVTATDLPDNYPAVALTSSIESESFVIDNAPPRIEGLSAKSEGGKLVIRFHAADALSDLDSSEFSVNGAEWKPARPVTGMTDSGSLDYLVETALPSGTEWTVAVRVTDENDNVAVGKIVVRP